MSNAGIPLRVIQEISGHRNLEELQKYLEVSDSQVLGAAATLAMLSPVGENVGKYGLTICRNSLLTYSNELQYNVTSLLRRGDEQDTTRKN